MMTYELNNKQRGKPPWRTTGGPFLAQRHVATAHMLPATAAYAAIPSCSYATQELVWEGHGRSMNACQFYKDLPLTWSVACV